MTSLRKLVAKFLAGPAEADVSDVIRLLKSFGFSHRAARGSHQYFAGGDLRISVPTVHGRKVKGPYIRRLVKLLELEAWFDEQKAIEDGPEEEGP